MEAAIVERVMGYADGISKDEFVSGFASVDGTNKWMLISLFHSISQVVKGEDLISLKTLSMVIEREKPAKAPSPEPIEAIEPSREHSSKSQDDTARAEEIDQSSES